MNPFERSRVISVLCAAAIAGGAACGQSPSEGRGEIVSYSSFTVNVEKTNTHPAYEVHNAILQPPKDGVGGIEKSTIKFCSHENPDIVIEVPVSETDYVTKVRAAKEEKNHYTARTGPKPCELVLENGTILRVLAFKR